MKKQKTILTKNDCLKVIKYSSEDQCDAADIQHIDQTGFLVKMPNKKELFMTYELLDFLQNIRKSEISSLSIFDECVVEASKGEKAFVDAFFSSLTPAKKRPTKRKR